MMLVAEQLIKSSQKLTEIEDQRDIATEAVSIFFFRRSILHVLVNGDSGDINDASNTLLRDVSMKESRTRWVDRSVYLGLF